MDSTCCNGRKVGYVSITSDAIIRLFNGKHWVRGKLPEGLRAVAVHTDFATQSFFVVVEGECLPYVHEGDSIPRIATLPEFEMRNEP